MSVVSKILVKIFTVECDLSMKLKTHSFADVCLYEILSLLLREELTLELCTDI
jgi:hypothetical protein